MRQVLKGREVAFRTKSKVLNLLAVRYPHSAATEKSNSLYVAYNAIFKREEVLFMKKSKLIVLSGLLIALNIILTRLIAPINLQYLRVTFGFIADAFGGIILGPVLGGIASAISDLIGVFLFSSNGAFFPGFTLSAFTGAFIYGLVLRKNPGSIYRILVSVLLVTIVVDLTMNTAWLSIMYKKAWTVFFTARLAKSLIFMPIQVVVIKLLWKYTGKEINKLF